MTGLGKGPRRPSSRSVPLPMSLGGPDAHITFGPATIRTYIRFDLLSKAPVPVSDMTPAVLQTPHNSS